MLFGLKNIVDLGGGVKFGVIENSLMSLQGQKENVS